MMRGHEVAEEEWAMQKHAEIIEILLSRPAHIKQMHQEEIAL
ncbi:hypothetical protein C032_03025 [Brucella abortus 63/294]|nr:hypothetical protein C032_03025 [Brucella abortus 63/294]ENS09114.1 hypothetical protein C980_02205 [Brucella abortus 88/217]ERU05397.1 hypothetical protein P039_01694 [Brucella abortus 07-0994-2411]